MIEDGHAQLAQARSFLFVPGNRPDRFTKAAASGADVVILDLEDAVAPSQKDAAREHVRRWLAEEHRAVVRVNAAHTRWHRDDLCMLGEYPTAVMIPKAEQPSTIREVACTTGGLPVIPLIETAAGISKLAATCRTSSVVRLAFGSIDLATQIGVDPDDREALLYARTSLVLASAAGGLAPPIDGVTTTIGDTRPVSEDTRYARRLGMTAKLCIHPSQIATAHEALAPSPEERRWAQRILAATSSGESAVMVDGAMVDSPVVERAHRIIGTPL